MKKHYQERITISDNIMHSRKLTASEIGNLWNNYIEGTVVKCILTSFLTNVEDQDIRALMEENLTLVKQRESIISDIYRKEGLTLPLGFSENSDLELMAPRLYSDYFYLQFIKCIQKFEMPLGSLDFVTSTRSDVLDYYELRSSSSIMLYKKIVNLLLAKGIYVGPPSVTIQNGIDMVEKQSFLTGFLGEKRPLLAQEISGIYYLLLPNLIAKYMLMGFRQTARATKVHEFMDRGINLIEKIIDTMAPILEAEDIPIPTVSDFMVTASTEPTFSDRLMMYNITLLNGCAMLNAVYMINNSLRHDITAKFMTVLPAASNYAEDGINILIENGWLEEPPRTVDRRKLVNELEL
jgi:hypothetical protein